MRRELLSCVVAAAVVCGVQIPGVTSSTVSVARAQVAVVGGGASFGLSNGFGSYGSQSSFTSGTTLLVTPGMSVGAVTYGPYGAYTNYGIGGGWNGGYFGPGYYGSGYYGGGPFVGYAPGGYGFSYGYPNFGRWGGWYGRPYINGFALPPAIIPAEVMYGPAAVQRVMGVAPPLGTSVVNNTTYVNNGPNAAVNNTPTNGGGFGVNAGGVNPPKIHIAPTNAEARARSKRQLEIGDDWFRKQQYGEAWIAYKEAARAAPDVADAYFHQAAAAVAQRRYEAAVDALKYGLRISSTYVDGEFKYTKLYGDNRLAQTSHLEALAQAALDQPSADLYFLTGVMLFFDAEPMRSTPFFAKAREVQAGETWHIDIFRTILQRMEMQQAQGGQPVVNRVPAAAPAPKAPQQAKADAAGQEI